jgi:hypothetical protein
MQDQERSGSEREPSRRSNSLSQRDANNNNSFSGIAADSDRPPECRLSVLMAEALKPSSSSRAADQNFGMLSMSTREARATTGASLKGALPWFRGSSNAATGGGGSFSKNATPAQQAIASVSSPPTPTQSLALRTLTVEEIMRLREVFDRWTEVQPVPAAVLSSGKAEDILDAEAAVEAATLAAGRRGKQFQPLYLDTFYVTALLSRAGVAVPAGSDLRKIIAKVQSLNAHKTETASAHGSAYLYPTGTDLSGPRSPILSFDMFCQVAELVKRHVLRNRDTSSSATETFMHISRNKELVLAGGGSSRRAGSVTPSSPVLCTASAESLNLEAFSLEVPSLSIDQPQPTLRVPKGTIPVAVLQDMLHQAGAAFDFVTLLRSLKKEFDGHVDADAFRWITGSEDPDIVKAFVALGGEPTLSGSIPTDVLISKCSAMKMSPQAVANFVARVDVNGDGHIDYNEFVSMIVQQKLARAEGLVDDGGALSRASKCGQLGRSSGAEAAATAANSSNGGGPSSSPPTPDPNQRRSAAPFQKALWKQHGAEELLQRRSFFMPIEDDAMADDDAAAAAAVKDHQDSVSSSDSSTSLVVDESDAAGHARKNPTDKHHLQMGLSDLLAASFHAAPQKDLQQRIEETVSRGKDSVARCRTKAEACVEEQETARSVCLIRTDEGVVQASRTAEPALIQRARLKRQKQQAAEQARARMTPPVSPRLTALPRHREQLLRETVAAAAEDLKARETQAAERAERRAAVQQKGRSKDGHSSSVIAPTAELFAVPLPLCTDAEEEIAVVPTANAHPTTAATTIVVDTLRASPNTRSTPRPADRTRPLVSPAMVRDELRIIPANEIHGLQNGGHRRQNFQEYLQEPLRPPSAVPCSRPQTVTPHPPPQGKPSMDDQLLWKLLDNNFVMQRQMQRGLTKSSSSSAENMAQQCSSAKNIDSVTDASRLLSSVASRRIYARTLASHLALQLPYDDEMMIGDVAKCITPMALRTAAVSRAYVSRPGSTTGEGGSGASRPSSAHCAAVVWRPGGTPRQSPAPPAHQQGRQRVSSPAPHTVVTVPSRPTTAPSRRPTSASKIVTRPPSAATTAARILRDDDDNDDDSDGDTMYLS